ncbi:MAG: VWA domain-containing protein [Candidatus Woesearchaeota archaeon]
MKKIRKKRGVFFILDAIFAVSLIALALVLFYKFFILDVKPIQIKQSSNDLIYVLSNIKISEINDSYVKALINEGKIQNKENTLLEQIGEFYVLNMTEYSKNLSELFLKGFDKYGFEILINNERIYYKEPLINKKDFLISSKRLISGIEKFKPLKGATSKVYLSGIEKKKYSEYVYFGGFVGQGNISVKKYLPNNLNFSNIYLELNSVSDFIFYINNNKCSDVFNPSGSYMGSDSFYLENCTIYLEKNAVNNFTFVFLDTLDKSYIGGGYLRIDYYTDEMKKEEYIKKSNTSLYGINGIINIYDSFYVPGNLINISVYLHYFSSIQNITNNTFYFTIGNNTIYRDSNLTGEKTAFLDFNNITSKISTSILSNNNIPFRIGFENASFGYIYEGNADVALITDVSGSMGWQMINSDTGINRSCNDPNFNNTDTSRISVARCVDKEFVNDILNITGNKLGLVSYSSSTVNNQIISPTTDSNLLISTINNYTANGGTCICCGINSARLLLANKTRQTILISRNSNWLYNNYSFFSEPEKDLNNNTWKDYSYLNESQWFNENTILGSTNSFNYYPYVNKEIGSNLSYNSIYLNLWEHYLDEQGNPNDFSSGVLNYTANTYGINGNDDGWDWDTRNGSGIFGYDDDIDYNMIVSGKLEFDNNYGGSGNICSNRDCSGSYGIKINITEDVFNSLQNGGKAILSFYYEWHEENGNPFETSDQAWIKARWTSLYSGQHYLGSNYDYYGLVNAHSGADNTYEIATSENPDVDFSGNYLQDISSFIEGPGYYYLELGGKILADSSNEWGYIRFDNVQIEITNSTNSYYFRKNFTISDLSLVKKGILNLLSDDYAEVYLNGELIDLDITSHTAQYWNRRGIKIEQDKFLLGNNVLAVKLVNSNLSAKFDLELIGLNDSRDYAMLVMTDGQANYYCSDYNDTTGSYDEIRAISSAINASCYAKENIGVNVYAVGFSDDADEDTLKKIADCGSGVYTKSNNITKIKEFYKDVASSIVSASRHSQTIEMQGNITYSVLYPDSYIFIEYLPETSQANFGEISKIIEEKNFQNCSFNISILNEIRVSDAKLTSYSAEHWTDSLIVNGNNVYNLSLFSKDYTGLGDPFIINIPVSYLNKGNNFFEIRTGDNIENSTGCSLNNTFIYTANVLSSASYNDILEKAIGCNWFIEFDDGENISINVPPDYSGEKICNYTREQILSGIKGYDLNDTYDDAMFQLLSNLDFDKDGRIFINIKENDLIVGAISVGKVPYPWGPAIAEIRVFG